MLKKIKNEIFYYLARIILPIYASFLDVDVNNPEFLKRFGPGKGPAIIVFQHKYLIPLLITLLYYFKGERNISSIKILTARHSEANIASKLLVLDTHHVPINRPSTIDERLASIKKMERYLLNDEIVCLSIDERKKSERERILKNGAVWLSKRTNAPIIPVSLSTSCAIETNTWDKMIVPIPFGYNVSSNNKYRIILNVIIGAIIAYFISFVTFTGLRVGKALVEISNPIYPENLDDDANIDRCTRKLDDFLFFKNKELENHMQVIYSSWKLAILRLSVLVISLLLALIASFTSNPILKVSVIFTLMVTFFATSILWENSSAHLLANINDGTNVGQTINQLKMLIDKVGGRQKKKGKHHMLRICMGSLNSPVFFDDEFVEYLKEFIKAGNSVMFFLSKPNQCIEGSKFEEISKDKPHLISIWANNTNKNIHGRFAVMNNNHVVLQLSRSPSVKFYRKTETYFFAPDLAKEFLKRFQSLVFEKGNLISRTKPN